MQKKKKRKDKMLANFLKVKDILYIDAMFAAQMQVTIAETKDSTLAFWQVTKLRN